MARNGAVREMSRSRGREQRQISRTSANGNGCPVHKCCAQPTPADGEAIFGIGPSGGYLNVDSNSVPDCDPSDLEHQSKHVSAGAARTATTWCAVVLVELAAAQAAHPITFRPSS